MKTKPIGVRFDTEKAESVMQKRGLKTHQALVNFLLDKEYGRREEKAVKVAVLPPVVEIAASVTSDNKGWSYAEILRRAKNGAKYSVNDLRAMGFNPNQVNMIIGFCK